MKKSISFLLLTISFISCSYNKGEIAQTKYHNDGRPKPLVAFCPIVDSSSHNMTWPLEEEFFQKINNKIKKKNNLYIYELESSYLPSIHENNWFHEKYWQNLHPYPFQYVCILEIIDHNFIARDSSPNIKKVSHDLDISLRLKIIDVRKKKPTVVLQEIIHQRNFIPWQFNFINYKKMHWDKTSFQLTPVGLAHKKIINTAIQRMEEYILLAQINYEY